MYKNVLHQRTVALILSLFLCIHEQPASASISTPSQSSSVNNNYKVIKSVGLQNSNTDSSKLAEGTAASIKKTNPPVVETKPVDPIDTSFHPVRRLWGLAFGDFYYDAHADMPANRGAETNYNGVPTYRNSFQFRRIYLGYDYDINKQFTVEVLLASEPSANTAVSGTTTISNGDNLADNKMSFYIKNFDLRWRNVWKGTDFLIGEELTPAFPLLTEKIWGYRAIERTISDFHRTNAYDVGAALQGTFDPKTKNYGYDVMIGNNSTANLLSTANANTGFFKAFYGDVYAKLLSQRLIFDLYADYMQTSISTTVAAVPIGPQSRNMVKGFVAWTTPKITFGVEAYTQQIANAVTATNGTNKTAQSATVNAISIYSHGAIYKDKLGFFARYDGYNPDNSFKDADAYTTNTNLAAYNPYYKEHFVTAGFDFTPSKTVHFMPNIWLIQYQDQRTPTTAGYVPDNHTLVYRLTFFFQFGK